MTSFTHMEGPKLTSPPSLQLIALAAYVNKWQFGPLLQRIPVCYRLDLVPQLRPCCSRIPKSHWTAYPRVRVRIRKLRSHNRSYVMDMLCIRCHDEWDYK